MQRVILIFLLVLGIHLSTPTSAWACTCRDWDSVEEMLVADAVFLGTLTHFSESAWGFKPVFAVEKVWKGWLGKEVTVSTSDSSAACGFPFVADKKYIVYAYGRLSNLTTTSCSGTHGVSTLGAETQAIQLMEEVAYLHDQLWWQQWELHFKLAWAMLLGYLAHLGLRGYTLAQLSPHYHLLHQKQEEDEGLEWAITEETPQITSVL